jgi:hypothetical protein
MKGAGKDTAANFILGLYMIYLNIVRKEQKDNNEVGGFSITNEGKLYITNLFGDTEYAGIFDYERQSEYLDDFKREHLDKYIRIYSFADMLKKNVCMDLLGLSYEQCYGTNEQKNTLTKLKWENMPGITDKTGQMTAREVLQYVGTELFRKMNPEIWASATIRKIQKDKPIVAVIKDVRFPNEVDAIHELNGVVLRLNRSPYKNEDSHSSENLLSEENYDWNNFNLIINNQDISIKDQNTLIYIGLSKFGAVPDVLDIEVIRDA